jgi:voltage-gated potassium channel
MTIRTYNWKSRLHEIIYESDTAEGKAFDVALLILILASILVVMLESVQSLRAVYGNTFYVLEWIFTIIFTIEYILRLISIKRPLKYAVSFLGIIDLLAILPTYLSIFFVGTAPFLVLRGLRLLRIFRIFKLTHFLSELQYLGGAIRSSAKKISIFMLFVLTLITIQGSIMYVVEGGENGFTSIPTSIYWGIVTITTVGYGDISPVTPLGKFLASIIMLTGYSIIAVPTGIVTTEIALALRNNDHNSNVCPGCGKEGHDVDARYCRLCGEAL